MGQVKEKLAVLLRYGVIKTKDGIHIPRDPETKPFRKSEIFKVANS
jgi:hypothetical protein